jgi:hypothetical protein
MTQRKTIFISTPPIDAYWKWKSYWGLKPNQRDSEVRLIDDVPNRGVRWSERWGLARIYGQADFIPVQGGCVVHLAITGASSLSRLMLSSPLERFFWRAAERFRPIAEGYPHEGAA